MTRQVLSDAVAYIRGLAQLRGRNAEWAEKAVRESVNVTAEEALKLGVIDMLASTREELIAKLDGVSGHCAFWVHTTAWTASPSIRPFIPADVAKKSPEQIERWAENYIRRKVGSVSIRPRSWSTRVSSWCSQPGWFSSEPRWWSTVKSTRPSERAAAPRYTDDLPQ